MSFLQRFRENALVVIPAYEEVSSVADVVARVRAQGFDVVVVDDGSADDTAAEARLAGATVLELPFRAGAWAAIQTGIRYAIWHGYAFVVTLDADGQHDPAAIPAMLDAYQTGCQPNVVVGSCTSRGSRGRQLTWRVFRIFGGLHINDLTSGYRIYDRRAMELVASKQAALLEFQDVGVLLLLKRAGMRLCEVDIEMKPRAAGKSRIFRSWLKVVYYLVYSLLLIASKFRPTRRVNNGAVAGNT